MKSLRWKDGSEIAYLCTSRGISLLRVLLEVSQDVALPFQAGDQKDGQT